jgi:hypothetical protein
LFRGAVGAIEFGEGAAGFGDAAMAEFFAQGESGGEALAGEFDFAKAQLSEAAEVEGFWEVAGGEVGFGEGDADVDGVFAEAAGISEEDAGFAFGDGLGETAEVTGEFAGGLEAAELEFDFAGFLGECAGLLQMFCRCRRLINREQASE